MTHFFKRKSHDKEKQTERQAKSFFNQHQSQSPDPFVTALEKKEDKECAFNVGTGFPSSSCCC